MTATVSTGGERAATATRRASLRFQVKPTRSDIVDAVFAFALCVLGILGFRTTYGGVEYLVIGAVAAVFGIALAYVANRLGQPVLGLAAVTVIVFFVFGGVVALRTTAVGGVLPTLSTVRALANAAVSGWRQLLTTLPPVGESHHLMALPYVIGLLGGVTSMCAAGRSRKAVVPLVAPLAVLAVGILFGAAQPAGLFWQGSLFGVLALAWIVLRHQRLRPVIAGRGRASRMVGAVGLLACACAAAQFVGPGLPLAGSHDRVVLRTYTVPPFDPGAYPSPLAGFRHYIGPDSELNDTTLFTVTGLPKGARVRIATTDAYNGVVWGFNTDLDAGVSASDDFQQVGSSIPPVVSGDAVTLHVTIGAYGDVWLPDAGYLVGVKFEGHDARGLEKAFDYNLATGTGVVTSGLRSGDTYVLKTLIPAAPDPQTLDGASASKATLPITGAPPQVATDAKQWAGSAAGAYSRLQAIATHMKTNGEYSDGNTTDDKSTRIMPGHSTKRIADFLNGQQLVGDGEQYATTMALMANALGYPARVVFGAVPEANGVVKGKDIAAWAEVDFAGIGWVPFDATPPQSEKPKPQPPEPEQQSDLNQVVPPPPVAAPPPANNPSQTSTVDKEKTHAASRKSGGGVVPHWVVAGATYGGPPLGLVVVLVALVLALKWGRRRHRRRRGSVTRRLAGGWHEAVDVARDFGVVVPPRRTRREQAAVIADAQLEALARHADAVIFGPGLPQDADVDDYWAQVDAALDKFRRGATRWRRLRAAVSLRSLRRPTSADPSTLGARVPRPRANADRVNRDLVGSR